MKPLFWMSLICGSSICAAVTAAEPSLKEIRVVLVGDSTVADNAGWGSAFAELLKPEAACFNHGKGGASTKSFYKGNYWENALARKPDFVLIQFGHNDQPGKGPQRETDPQTTYRENLVHFITEARAAGAQPILVTSLVRRIFLPDGKLQGELAPYAAAARAVAKEQNVPLVDLFARSMELHERIGVKASQSFGPIHPTLPGKFDGTHLSKEGARQIARIVADELKQAAPELAAYIRADSDAAPKSP
ncbi:MAG: pectin esterase [Pirellula sp.]|nr:pectin esterase [Pirellula sp.]